MKVWRCYDMSEICQKFYYIRHKGIEIVRLDILSYDFKEICSYINFKTKYEENAKSDILAKAKIKISIRVA